MCMQHPLSAVPCIIGVHGLVHSVAEVDVVQGPLIVPFVKLHVGPVFQYSTFVAQKCGNLQVFTSITHQKLPSIAGSLCLWS